MLFSSPETGSVEANHIFQLDGEDDSSSTDSLDDTADNLSTVTHFAANDMAEITPEVKSMNEISTSDQTINAVVATDKQTKSLDSLRRLQHSECDNKVNRKRKLQPIVAVAQIVTDKHHTESPVKLLHQKCDLATHPDEEKTVTTSKIKPVPVLKFNQFLASKDSKIDAFGKLFNSQTGNELADKQTHCQSVSPSKRLKSHTVSKNELVTTGQEFNFDEEMRRDFRVGGVTANVRGKTSSLSLRDSNRTLMHYFNKTVKGPEDEKSTVARNKYNNGTLCQSTNEQNDMISSKDMESSTSKTVTLPSTLNDDVRSMQSPIDTILWSSIDSGSITFPAYGIGDRNTSDDVMMNLSFPSPVDNSPTSSTPPKAQSPGQFNDHYNVENGKRELLGTRNEPYDVKDQLDSFNYIELCSSFGSIHQADDGHDTTLDSRIRPILASSIEDKKCLLQHDRTLGTEIDKTDRKLCNGLVK